jgi:hypothetical protein
VRAWTPAGTAEEAARSCGPALLTGYLAHPARSHWAVLPGPGRNCAPKSAGSAVLQGLALRPSNEKPAQNNRMQVHRQALAVQRARTPPCMSLHRDATSLPEPQRAFMRASRRAATIDTGQAEPAAAHQLVTGNVPGNIMRRRDFRKYISALYPTGGTAFQDKNPLDGAILRPQHRQPWRDARHFDTGHRCMVACLVT